MIHCKGKKVNGEPCNAKPNAGGFCFAHDPNRKRDADRARRLGGKHRRRVLNDTPFPECDVKTAQGLTAFVESVMRETWRLESGVARSRTLGYLAQVQKGIIEVGELEERVTRLEQSIGEQKK
ncbi:MAG: hypothetical protein FJ009_20310 [Chloroflexi bacterium]|nr:hypothetical protein [Chloroflexota bacterium]